MADLLQFRTRYEDYAKIVELDGPVWPDTIKICDRFLVADPWYVTRDGDLITIAVANGRATYRITEYCLDWFGYEATAVERATWPTGKKPEWLDG